MVHFTRKLGYIFAQDRDKEFVANLSELVTNIRFIAIQIINIYVRLVLEAPGEPLEIIIDQNIIYNSLALARGNGLQAPRMLREAFRRLTAAGDIAQ